MEVRDLHPWDVSVAEAKRIQEEMRERLQLVDAIRPDDVHVVAGIDNGYSRHESGSIAYAAIVIMSFPELEIIETDYASQLVTFPYVPGLLTFREAPAILEALRRVTIEPDVFLFDGQGYAHPRRIGFASHLGVVLDRPTIGCAKSRLTGKYQEPPDERGAHTFLTDRGEVIGAAVRTRPGHSPLFVSPGNHLTVETAVQITLACCRDDNFLPEPTRLAHNCVAEYKREVLGREL